MNGANGISCSRYFHDSHLVRFRRWFFINWKIYEQDEKCSTKRFMHDQFHLHFRITSIFLIFFKIILSGNVAILSARNARLASLKRLFIFVWTWEGRELCWRDKISRIGYRVRLKRINRQLKYIFSILTVNMLTRLKIEMPFNEKWCQKTASWHGFMSWESITSRNTWETTITPKQKILEKTRESETNMRVVHGLSFNIFQFWHHMIVQFAC